MVSSKKVIKKLWLFHGLNPLPLPYKKGDLSFRNFPKKGRGSYVCHIEGRVGKIRGCFKKGCITYFHTTAFKLTFQGCTWKTMWKKFTCQKIYLLVSQEGQQWLGLRYRIFWNCVCSRFFKKMQFPM